MLKFEKYVVNHFDENTYLVYDEASRKAVIIDPGAVEPKLDHSIDAKGLKVECILCTHGHVDHIAGARYYQKALRAPFLIPKNEQMLIDTYERWAPMLGFVEKEAPVVEGFIEDDQTIHLGESFLKVLPTPGHTPGGVCFHCAAQKVVFSGDTLFQGSIGRSDLPGGNGAQLIDSIQNNLLVLPDDTDVLPGHGGESTIGEEKRHNPFL